VFHRRKKQQSPTSSRPLGEGDSRFKVHELLAYEFLLRSSEHLESRGIPWAAEFGMMTNQSLYPGTPMLEMELVATQMPRPHEFGPAMAIVGPFAMAQQRNDVKVAKAVVIIGSALLAKWPAWLAISADGHPN
jgi:hypothetical protein